MQSLKLTNLARSSEKWGGRLVAHGVISFLDGGSAKCDNCMFDKGREAKKQHLMHDILYGWALWMVIIFIL